MLPLILFSAVSVCEIYTGAILKLGFKWSQESLPYDLSCFNVVHVQNSTYAHPREKCKLFSDIFLTIKNIDAISLSK